MKRIAVNIDPPEWDHLISKYPPNSKKVTIANFTAGTKNIDTDVRGLITKRFGGTLYSTLPTVAKDQYEVIFANGARHLLTVDNGVLRYSSGDGAENLVTAGYSAGANFEFITTQDRAYFGNGVDLPQVYDKTAVYGGVTYSVPKTKDMGAQLPLTAPTATLAAGGSVPDGGHTYKITFLYYGFEESNEGPTSNLVTAGGGNNTVNLTGIPVGGYGVTARKIYRDNNDGNYELLDTILNNTATTYSDTLSIGATPTPIPVDNNEPPTFGLIASWLGHVWVAAIPGSPYDLAYSEATLPDIFPAEFRLTCNEQDPVTAIVVYAGRLVVLNRKSLGQILGSTSNDFGYDPIINTNSVGCVDNRTVQIRVVNGVPLLIWLSDRGFYSYDGNSIEYISDPIEDVVNFNIQQTLQQKGSNNQSTQSDFEAGTPSNGIDLISDPGVITTKNPKKVWQSESDWEAGSSFPNVVTRDGTNTIKGLPKFQALYNNGTLENLLSFIGPGGRVVLIVASGDTGTWTSETIDTACLNPSLINLLSPTTLNGSHTTTTIRYSDDGSVFTAIAAFSDITSNQVLALSGHRYWQISIQINGSSAFVGDFNNTYGTDGIVLSYDPTSVWISEAIDCTSDVTSYDTFTPISIIPAGTTVTIEVATSDNNILYTAFGPFGAAIVKRYLKVRVTMTLDAPNLLTPSVASILFNWTIVANLISSAIDTSVTPVGWDVFASSFLTNGGTVVFKMRSATTAIGLGVATFFVVTNGSFPPSGVSPLRFVQWQVIITSTANNVPTIDGVTISWFIGTITSIRPASIFVDGRYYLSVAKFGSTINNLVIELDLKGKWRFHEDLTISTLSFFFNKPYYGSSSTGIVVKWLQGFQDQGSNIPIDVRFKDLEFDTQNSDNGSFKKVLDYLVFEGFGTGAAYSFDYSVDGGLTFTSLKYENGSTTYSSAIDNKPFHVRFKAVKDDTSLITGESLLIRMTTNDQYDIAVKSLKVYAWMWEFEPFLLQ